MHYKYYTSFPGYLVIFQYRIFLLLDGCWDNSDFLESRSLSHLMACLYPLPLPLLLSNLHETEAKPRQWLICPGLLYLRSFYLDWGDYYSTAYNLVGKHAGFIASSSTMCLAHIIFHNDNISHYHSYIFSTKFEL